MAKGSNTAEIIRLEEAQVGNGAAENIEFSEPYTVSITVEGVAALLFHRYDCDEVESKSKAAKGSKAKKTDNIESYIYRLDNGEIGLPGEYLRQAIIHAAKFRQDPRSPRKSAMDLFKAGIVSLTDLASLGVKEWDYEDRRRVVVQRSAVPRVRPAFRSGWHASVDLMVHVPEYISPVLLRQVLDDAGRLIGVGDFRPTYGRFAVSRWKVAIV